MKQYAEKMTNSPKVDGSLMFSEPFSISLSFDDVVIAVTVVRLSVHSKYKLIISKAVLNKVLCSGCSDTLKHNLPKKQEYTIIIS